MNAQEGDFFTVIDMPENLSVGKIQFINNILSESSTKNITYVEYQDLTNYLDTNGLLTLRILTDENTFQVVPAFYEQDSIDNYIWMGKIENDGGFAGLILKNGRLGGYVQSIDAFWEIMPLVDGISIIRELNTSEYFNYEDHHSEISDTPPPKEDGNNFNICGDEFCQGIIDVLVLVSPDVIEWYGDEFENPWESLFHYGFSLFSFQAALNNSGLGDIRLRIKEVLYDEIDVSPGIGYLTILDSLKTRDSLRDQYRADLIVFLTSIVDTVTIGSKSVLLGVASSTENFGTFSNPDSRFTSPRLEDAFIVASIRSSFNPRWTLAHELGHLFGARHNRSTNLGGAPGGAGDDGNVCTHAWRFTVGGFDRTLVSSFVNNNTTDSTSQIVLQFSDEENKFNGFETGNNSNRNTSAVKNGACRVMNYQPSPDFGIGISGTDVWCHRFENDLPQAYNVVIDTPFTGFPGIPPYSYEWRYNKTGDFNTYSVFLGNNNNVTFSNVPACPRIFLKVTVTSSDNQSLSRTKIIETSDCPTCLEGYQENVSQKGYNNFNDKEYRTKGEGVFLTESEFEIFPNPTFSKINITATSETSGFSIKLIDLNGKILEEISHNKTNQLVIDLVKFPIGTYILYIYNGSSIAVYKVIRLN